MSFRKTELGEYQWKRQVGVSKTGEKGCFCTQCVERVAAPSLLQDVTEKSGKFHGKEFTPCFGSESP